MSAVSKKGEIILKNNDSKARKPMGKVGRVLLSLLITAAVGFVDFYVSLPALNPQSADFYTFLALLCVVYTISIFVLSAKAGDNVVRTPKAQIREWQKKVCSPA